MTSTELVGPLPVITFGGGPRTPISEWGARPKVAYVPPVNSLDPRFAACTDHHVACDCREAEWAEQAGEYRYEQRLTQSAFDTILAGHATWPRERYERRIVAWSGDEPVVVYEEAPQQQCECTGCQIARAAYIYPREP